MDRRGKAGWGRVGPNKQTNKQTNERTNAAAATKPTYLDARLNAAPEANRLPGERDGAMVQLGKVQDVTWKQGK
jgi:hypothetical protein